MSLGVPLKPNAFYHIYLSGEHQQTLFKSERAYEQFLQLYIAHTTPIADTYAYCLLPNHFHFFVRIHTLKEQIKRWANEHQDIAAFQPTYPHEQYAKLLAAYANQVKEPFHQLENQTHIVHVSQRQQFAYLIRYIHQNPAFHNYVENFREWRWSSYRALLAERPTRIPVSIVMRWFHSAEWFEELHWETQDVTQLGYLIVND